MHAYKSQKGNKLVKRMIFFSWILQVLLPANLRFWYSGPLVHELLGPHRQKIWQVCEQSKCTAQYGENVAILPMRIQVDIHVHADYVKAFTLSMRWASTFFGESYSEGSERVQGRERVCVCVWESCLFSNTGMVQWSLWKSLCSDISVEVELCFMLYILFTLWGVVQYDIIYGSLSLSHFKENIYSSLLE